ncbi:Crp/Fnr family transcriptional regulator [Gluconacetobacter diazotrophicus]|uniref:Crp/Fnr family transcriptional regulator n=1 Tax=Gluconacetobacter diazotrophicus TaxID=33996 RepID=UPI0002E4DCBA|nr:Crp/Fnr family transcriptional regulator [Gluconacetobacter diazotrophicus]
MSAHSHGPPSILDLLERPEAGTLQAAFRAVTFQRGQRLSNLEDTDSIFIVRTGRLRAFLLAFDRELSLAYLHRGDMFSTHTRVQMEASEVTHLLMARRSAIERISADHPALQHALIHGLARILGQTITLLEDLAFHHARGRIARYILRSAAHAGIGIEGGQVVPLSLGMEDMAALLGTTRQTVSTEFNAMIREGAFSRERRGYLRLGDVALLKNWASGEETRLA